MPERLSFVDDGEASLEFAAVHLHVRSYQIDVVVVDFDVIVYVVLVGETCVCVFVKNEQGKKDN